MCMCMKFSSRDLNSDSCPPHSTSKTCGVIITPNVCGGSLSFVEMLTSIEFYDIHEPLNNKFYLKSSKQLVKRLSNDIFLIINH